MSAHKELETQFVPVIYTSQNEGWHPKKLAAALVDLLPTDKPERKYSTGELLCLKALREINQMVYQAAKTDILANTIERLTFPFTITGPSDSELDRLIAEDRKAHDSK